MKKLLAIILTSAFFTACGGASGGNSVAVNSPAAAKSDKIVVKIKGEEKPFEVKKGVATVREDLRGLYFVLANYDIDMTGKEALTAPRTTAEGQMRIIFGVTNKVPGTDYKMPIPPGDYESLNVSADIDRDGKPGTGIGFMTNTPQKITITSITNETVTGFVDYTAGENSIKGKFEAKILPD